MIFYIILGTLALIGLVNIIGSVINIILNDEFVGEETTYKH